MQVASLGLLQHIMYINQGITHQSSINGLSSRRMVICYMTCLFYGHSRDVWAGARSQSFLNGQCRDAPECQLQLAAHSLCIRNPFRSVELRTTSFSSGKRRQCKALEHWAFGVGQVVHKHSPKPLGSKEQAGSGGPFSGSKRGITDSKAFRLGALVV